MSMQVVKMKMDPAIVDLTKNDQNNKSVPPPPNVYLSGRDRLGCITNSPTCGGINTTKSEFWLSLCIYRWSAGGLCLSQTLRNAG